MNDLKKAQRIINQIADKNGLPPEEMKKKFGGKFRRGIRDYAIKKVRRKTKLTLKEIGDLFEGQTPKRIWEICKRREEDGK